MSSNTYGYIADTGPTQAYGSNNGVFDPADINDLIDGMKSDARIFADDTSLFVVVDDPSTSYEILNHDLKLVEAWAKQWHMSFNPDPNKPPIEIVFSTKNKPLVHKPLIFNGIEVKSEEEHKHF